MSPGQNVTRTKCHPDKMSPGQNITGQNGTGQNVTRTKCHRTKYHPEKIMRIEG